MPARPAAVRPTTPARSPALAPPRCAHCGLPVPAGLVEHAADGSPAATQFFCHGCRTAFGVISACGLAGYYELLRAGGDSARPVADHGPFAEYDDSAFADLYTRPAGGDGVRSV